MKQETIALLIKLNRNEKGLNEFYFNDTMLHAVSSGLSTVYSEVFVWAFKNYLAVWVTGTSSEILTKTFEHHQSHFESSKILKSKKALQLFQDIIDGDVSGRDNMIEKFETFCQGFELAMQMDSLGQSLMPTVEASMAQFTQAPIVAGFRNSWNYAEAKKKVVELVSGVVQVSRPDLFYRFCVN